MEDTDPAARIIHLIQQAAIATAAPIALSAIPHPAVLVVVGNGNIVSSHAPANAGGSAMGLTQLSADQLDKLLQLVDRWVTHSGRPAGGERL